MDGDERTHDQRTGHEPGDRVGLGRVVEDHAGDGDARTPDAVEEASDESFPASDPPAFAPGRPGRRIDGGIPTELPDPRDVP